MQSLLYSDIVRKDFLFFVCYRPFWCFLSSYYKKGSDCDRWHRNHMWDLNKSSALAHKFTSICRSTKIICIQISYTNNYVLTSTGQLQGFCPFSEILTLALWLDRALYMSSEAGLKCPFLAFLVIMQCSNFSGRGWYSSLSVLMVSSMNNGFPVYDAAS